MQSSNLQSVVVVVEKEGALNFLFLSWSQFSVVEGIDCCFCLLHCCVSNETKSFSFPCAFLLNEIKADDDAKTGKYINKRCFLKFVWNVPYKIVVFYYCRLCELLNIFLNLSNADKAVPSSFGGI